MAILLVQYLATYNKENLATSIKMYQSMLNIWPNTKKANKKIAKDC